MRLLVLLAAGTLARYALGGWIQPAGSTFPLGPLGVNCWAASRSGS